VIVADTGAILALLDSGDKHHEALLALYDAEPDAWVLPWAALPEVDYLLGSELGPRAREAFLADLATGAYRIEWGREDDLARAHRICRRHRALAIGLVDAIVIATAERLRAAAIATVDLRDFGAVKIEGNPRLFPRDL